MRLVHVDDESGNAPLPGAVRYEDLLASTSDEPLGLALSPDDLYVLYTGGTTGMPKAVLWRQHDIYMNAMGGRIFGTGEMVTSLDEIVARSRDEGPGSMTAAPLMHGAAQWAAFISLCGGRPFVMAPTTTHFDPAEVWAVAGRERIVSLSIVGDAFGRPLVDALESGDLDMRGALSGLLVLVTGGAALSAPLKQRFVDLLPNLSILDAGGSSESGSQMGQVSSRMQSATGRFAPNPGAVVVSEDLTRILSPGDDEIGWLAQQGLIPLGYLGDPEKTARTFPVIEGIRHSVPGDRARWDANGQIELLGRDSVTINSGGEKIFAEEVEAAIAEHPAVYDVVVTGRPSTRWGNEVVRLSSWPTVSSLTPRESSPRPLATLRGTNCRKKLSSVTRCSVRRPARPTIGGRKLKWVRDVRNWLTVNPCRRRGSGPCTRRASRPPIHLRRSTRSNPSTTR